MKQLPNHSPWLADISLARPSKQLNAEAHSETLIIGGGIAGIMTAYFILKTSSQKVLLLEAGRIAHGATGHNAGQIISNFEKGFTSLVKTYGLSLATRAQEEVLMAWDLLHQIQTDAGIKTPIHTFTGYSGFSELEDLLVHLENRYWLKKAGLNIQAVLIAADYPHFDAIPKHLEDIYAVAPKGTILDLLQTENESYFAVSFSKAGTTNSAHLTEELAQYLLEQYPSRFELFEHSPVTEVGLHANHVEVHTKNGATAKGARVILCTNGFEKFNIKNHAGQDVDKPFHDSVEGIIGYMSGFYENSESDPAAISYHGLQALVLKNDTEIPPYFYLTRRPAGPNKKLICLGGPEVLVASTEHYSRETHVFPEQAAKAMDSFLKTSYTGAPKHIDYSFLWHGLMGYTPTGLRCVGPDPKNPLLMYNLGCNGLGILSSIAGAKRVSNQVQGKMSEASLFDPIISMGQQKTHL